MKVLSGLSRSDYQILQAQDRFVLVAGVAVALTVKRNPRVRFSSRSAVRR